MGMKLIKKIVHLNVLNLNQLKKELPKTWEGYCRTHCRREGEAWVHFNSKLLVINELDNADRDYIEDRNLLPSKEYAEAMLALCQLIQLRDCYNDGWVPDWTNIDDKYIIYIRNNVITPSITSFVQHVLAFKSEKIRNEFLRNFKYLIEVAKPLL